MRQAAKPVRGGSRPGAGRKPSLTLLERAQHRVRRSPQLASHEDLILGTDWIEGDAHLRWVITATVREIVAWAEVTEQNARDATSG